MFIVLRKHLLAVCYLLIVAYFCEKIKYKLITKIHCEFTPKKFTPKNGRGVGGVKEKINWWGFPTWVYD